MYASLAVTQAQPNNPFSSPDYSRTSSRNSDNSYRVSYVPVQSTREPSDADPQQNVSQCQSLNQSSQLHYLQLDTQMVIPASNNASNQLPNLHNEKDGFQFH